MKKKQEKLIFFQNLKIVIQLIYGGGLKENDA